MWSIEPNQHLVVRRAQTDSAVEFEPTSVVAVFTAAVEKFGDKPALYGVRNDVPNEWDMLTYAEYYDKCMLFARALLSYELDPYSIINILGFNAPEWLIANCGSIMASCIPAGKYPSSSPPACHQIAKFSRTSVLVLDGRAQLMKYVEAFMEARADSSDPTNPFPHLRLVIVWGEPISDDIAGILTGIEVVSFLDFLARGASSQFTNALVLDRANTYARPGNCCSVVYTSGTTGPPKAVMLSHDNITWQARNLVENHIQINDTDRIVSFLPLSHISGQMLDIYLPMFVGAAVYFAQPDALKGSINDTIRTVKPTLFLAVPRVWEKMHSNLKTVANASTHAKALINTSRFVGKQFAQNKQFGGDGRLPCGYALADYFVFSRLRKHLGLEECRACFSAAAPLAVEVQQYFASMGIPVYEVYGQSECTGPHAMNKDGAWKIGTCGIPLKGVETKICPATGEICIRGRHVFMGYMYMPEKTEEVISFDGWMMTGDEGVLEVQSGFEQHPSLQGGSETFLRVTGRIKELIITAGGENIPPVLIENEMKGVMPALSHCIVIGEKLPYLTMLLTLKVELDPETFLPTKTLASDALNVSKKIGSKATTVDECMNDVAWQGYFERGRVCANHKAASNTQRVRKFALLPVDFSERGGELTPTLKMKRHVIEKQYEEVIDNMYAIHLDPTPDSRPKLERPDIA